MKVFNHEKPGTAVSAPAGQLQLLLTLLQNNQLVEPERALRLAGAAIFAAFHNFSNQHIQEAVDEAKRDEKADATLTACAGSKEHYEAEEAAGAAKAAAEKPAEKPAPPTAEPESIPEPVTPTPSSAPNVKFN